MSSSLYYEQVEPVDPKGGWGHPLKGIFARKYWGDDGSLGGGEVILTLDDIQFLETINLCYENDKDTVKAVNEMITAIRNAGAIRVFRLV